MGRAGGANYQACGLAGAEAQLRRAIEQALGDGRPRAACFCLAGADRSKDFAVLQGLIERLCPGTELQLENDSMAVLRAGTPNGVGIALIAGTGANAVGRRADGKKLQVGGLGRLSGDYGSAWQLGEAAVVAAMMDRDGRGPRTLLGEKICRALALGAVEDIIEREFFDWEGPRLNLGALAPLVFEAAAAGDQVALEILHQAGRQAARAAEIILERLFSSADEVTVVFGGAVFQRGAHPAMRLAAEERLLATGRNVKFVRLEAPPVLGAVLFALDRRGPNPTAAERLRQEILSVEE